MKGRILHRMEKRVIIYRIFRPCMPEYDTLELTWHFHRESILNSQRIEHDFNEYESLLRIMELFH